MAASDGPDGVSAMVAEYLAQAGQNAATGDLEGEARALLACAEALIGEDPPDDVSGPVTPVSMKDVAAFASQQPPPQESQQLPEVPPLPAQHPVEEEPAAAAPEADEVPVADSGSSTEVQSNVESLASAEVAMIAPSGALLSELPTVEEAPPPPPPPVIEPDTAEEQPQEPGVVDGASGSAALAAEPPQCDPQPQEGDICSEELAQEQGQEQRDEGPGCEQEDLPPQIPKVVAPLPTASAQGPIAPAPDAGDAWVARSPSKCSMPNAQKKYRDKGEGLSLQQRLAQLEFSDDEDEDQAGGARSARRAAAQALAPAPVPDNTVTVEECQPFSMSPRGADSDAGSCQLEEVQTC